ncbi:MAG: ATP-binding cassette domain-containing protein [Roseburia sp.]|nr:ATP-binding cassette domain-containing protein [Roseburia sp.]
MIEIEHLVKRYGSHMAVDDLSLQVEPGKIYGFLGPNGAGKSTTMNIITGYLAATAGTVKINGADVALEPEKAKRCVGYLPELPPLYMDMTVKEYLDFAAELKKIEKGKRAEQVAEAMEMTGITDVSGRLIRNLSKGYKQRVGFAQAVLGKPEIIILDEPTVGLDPKQIIEIRDLIKKLGESHTVILSSHILTEISAVCDHVFIISKGKLVASDSTENLLERMTGNQQISLLVKAEAETAEGALFALAGVERCELLEQREEGTAALLISAKKDCDIREDIFHTCAEAQLPILEMKTEEKSLEDVFLELTAKGGMGA